MYPSCKIYQGICQCGENYIGETVRNVNTRWAEHNNPTNISEPARHIANNIDHVINWEILSAAPKNKVVRKNLEALYIALLKPTLNAQKDFERLVLFRNGITQIICYSHKYNPND